MRVIHESLLARFRLPGRCEACRRPCFDGLDPHHIFGKGAGRVDIASNLIAICRDCHNAFHSCYTKELRMSLLQISAAREGTTPEEIEDKVMRLRASKLCKVWNVDAEVEPE